MTGRHTLRSSADIHRLLLPEPPKPQGGSPGVPNRGGARGTGRTSLCYHGRHVVARGYARIILASYVIPPDMMDDQPNEVIVLSAMGRGSKPYNQTEQAGRVLPRTGQG